MKERDKGKLTRRDFLKAGGLTAAELLVWWLAGCDEVPAQTKPTEVSHGLSTATATAAATAEIMPTMAAGVTKTAEGGLYWTQEEEVQVWNDPEIVKQIDNLREWREYWERTRVFAVDSNELQLHLIVDIYGEKIKAGDSDLAKRVMVCLQEKSNGKMRVQPVNMINPGDQGTIFQTKAPSGNELLPGTDPLIVSDGEGKLVPRDKDLLRVHLHDGYVIEHIAAGSGESGSWTPVAYDSWMPNVFAEKMWAIKQPTVGVWEAYSGGYDLTTYAQKYYKKEVKDLTEEERAFLIGLNGRQMGLKLNEEGLAAFKLNGIKGQFMSAPDGFLDVNGTWKHWNNKTQKIDLNIIDINGELPPAEIKGITRRVLEATKIEATKGEASMWSQEFGNAGMDIKPEKKTVMMEDFWMALYYSKTAPKDQWKNQGFTGSTYSDLKDWFSKNPKLNVQIPMPNVWGQNARVKCLGSAMDLSSVKVMMFTEEDWGNDPFSKAVIDTLTQNRNFFTGWFDKTVHRYGFVDYGGQPVFIGSSIKGHSYFTDSNIHGQMVNAKGDFNTRISTAWWNNSVGMIRNINYQGVEVNNFVNGIVDYNGLSDFGAYLTKPEERGGFVFKACNSNGENCFYPMIWTKTVEDLAEGELLFDK